MEQLAFSSYLCSNCNRETDNVLLPEEGLTRLAGSINMLSNSESPL